MKFKTWLETTGIDWAKEEVPPEPGTIPIPSNHVRLYHYTKVKDSTDESKHQAALLLKTNGLDITEAQGHTYGEPDVVWASVDMPYSMKVFAEFSVDLKDPRFGPYWRRGEVPRGDCYFIDSIKPEELLAVHEPWHRHFRYMLENNLIQAAKNGEYDYLLNTPEYAPAVIKVKSL